MNRCPARRGATGAAFHALPPAALATQLPRAERGLWIEVPPATAAPRAEAEVVDGNGGGAQDVAVIQAGSTGAAAAAATAAPQATAAGDVAVEVGAKAAGAAMAIARGGGGVLKRRRRTLSGSPALSLAPAAATL